MDAIFTISSIKQVAKLLWKEGQKKKIWAFHAPMGAGKTTLIHALCEELGVKDAVSSPTFAIINEYQIGSNGRICHMDWYRLKDEEEAMQAGVEDSILSGQTCFIEWPEKAAGILPADTLHIYMEVLDPDTRRISTVIPPPDVL